MNKQLILILGGVRSGKSRYAQQLAGETGDRVLFLATAEAGDDEMKRRIARHKASRPQNWRTVEEPLDIASALHNDIADDDAVIIDCVTVWLSNLLLREGGATEDEAMEHIERLIDMYDKGDATYIIVSGEVGMGIVPEHALARTFRDYLGLLNQRMAAAADRVVFMAAGIPLDLKKQAGESA